MEAAQKWTQTDFGHLLEINGRLHAGDIIIAQLQMTDRLVGEMSHHHM